MIAKIKQFLFRNTSPKQTVAKNTFWLSIAHVGGRLLRAIIIIYAARVLGASEWGVYNYAITLVAFLTIFVDMGLSNILTREAARTEDVAERQRIFSTAFLVKLVLIAGGVCVIVFVAPLITNLEGAKLLFPIVAWILIFDAVREFGFAYLRAMEKMEWEAILSILMNVAIVGLGFAFLKLHTNVVWFTYSYAIGTGIGMFATLYTLRKSFVGIRKSFTFALIKPIMHSAWPFAISGVLGMLTLNTDVIIIGWLRTATELGYYSAGTRLIQILYLIPSIISLSVLPTFARTARKDDLRFRQILERIVSMMFLVAVPIVVGGIIVATPLISFVFGSSYIPATLSFQLLLLTILIDFPAVVLSAAIFAYDRQKNLIAYAAIGGLLNVALDLILIPRFGIAGSAAATVAAQLVSNIYLWTTLKRINPFGVAQHLRKVVVAGAIMGLFTFFVLQTGLHVVGIIAASIPIYFGILILLKENLLLEIKAILRPVVLDVPKADESVSAVIREETHRNIEGS